MSKPRGTSARYLPWAPLRDALGRQTNLDGYLDTPALWRKLHSIDRQWQRAQASGRISEAQVDAWCCGILGVHPWTIYGEAWEAIPPRTVLDDITHGKPWGYNRGCRCDLCALAMTNHQRAYRDRKRKERTAA
jgi:hypothetical protein